MFGQVMKSAAINSISIDDISIKEIFAINYPLVKHALLL